jgi:hypothetical protein
MSVMRRGITVAVLLVASIGAPDTLFACGDKFVMVGRGVRFQHAYAAIHPASILVLLPPKSLKNAAVRDSRLQNALKMAGHRLELAQPETLADALRQRRFDIVLADPADVPALPDADLAAGSKPSVVAVRPQSVSDALKLVDDVMTARLEKARG